MVDIAHNVLAAIAAAVAQFFKRFGFGNEFVRYLFKKAFHKLRVAAVGNFTLADLLFVRNGDDFYRGNFAACVMRVKNHSRLTSADILVNYPLVHYFFV